jgi:tight adherence protein B
MTVWTIAAVLAAGCAAVVLLPAAGSSLRRLGRPPGGRDARYRRGVRGGRALASLVGLAAVALGWGGGRYLFVAVAGLALTALAHRAMRARAARTLRRMRQESVIRLCDSLAAEVRAGLPAWTAVARACSETAELAAVASAARLGGDVADALHRCGGLPGAEGLRAVGAAWQVAGSTGTGLAAVLDRIAAGLRSDDEARAEVRSALAPPRATARLLAVLPVFGIGLGWSIGADPVRFLLGTPWGLGCLSCGVVLALAGLWWVERLASAVEL